VAETVLVLTGRAKALRAAHAALAVVELASLGHVWRWAITGRRDRRLGWAVALLSAEAAALVAGRGNCPLGPLQRRWGDPKPLFELVLSPRAAKAAVPALAAVALGGVTTLGLRSGRDARFARRAVEQLPAGPAGEPTFSGWDTMDR
jgi:hypothetical protein